MNTAREFAASSTGYTRQFIGGTWREGRSGTVMSDINPYDGSLLTRIRGASVDDVADAYASAEKGQVVWAAMSPRERSGVLKRAADIYMARREEIIDLTIREAGAVRKFAEIITYFGWAQLDTASTFPGRVSGHIMPSDVQGEESFVFRKPVGVIGVISPWNAPINLTMRSLAPALACGNAVVLKPAGDTPITGGLLHASIFEQAGLPKGVLNVVVGASSEIGDAVVTNPASAFLSFTGSTEVGRSLYGKVGGSPRIKRLALELGGNAPFVVLEDAELDRAAHSLVVSRFLHQGQICMCANRAIVDERVYDEFVERVLARTRELPIGDPNDSKTAIGPLVNKAQVQAVLGRIQKAKHEGVSTLLEGPVRGSQQNIIPPHVFVDVESHHAIAQEESFGPLLPILRARNEQHALAIANDTQHGLSSAVFTRDVDRGRRFLLNVNAGMGHVNNISVGDSDYAPYGGEKNSGIGRFNAEWIIDEFTRPHWITLQHEPMPLPF